MLRADCFPEALLQGSTNKTIISLIETDRNTWNGHWPKISHAPLLQSWEYGEAKCRAQRFHAQRFLLQDEKGEPVGLVQALVYSLPLIGSVVSINRGPVFFSDSMRDAPSPEDVKEIVTAIRERAKRNRWRLLRIAPELLDNDDLSAQLLQIGFRKRTDPSWASAVIDISRSPEEIRAGFHPKWRNLLNKSEKMCLELEIPPVEDALPYLIRKYEAMQRDKGFKGLRTQLIEGMAEQEGLRIPVKPATQSGESGHPVGAKRRWGFHDVSGGRFESM